MLDTTALLFVLAAVLPDAEVGVTAETTGGRVPTGVESTANLVTFSVTPALGGLLTAPTWNARLDYRPRFYLRIPREDVNRPLLLNQFNGSLRVSIGSGDDLVTTGYVTVGEIDYGRASLLLDDITGQQGGQQVPPGRLLTNAAGTTLALTNVFDDNQRLLSTASFTFTELLSTAEGMTGENNPYPSQIRVSIGETYILPLTRVDDLSMNVRGGWTQLGTSALNEERAFRIVDVFGSLSHRFTRELRGNIDLGASAYIDEAELLPLVTFGARYDRLLSPSMNLGILASAGVQGFVNPTLGRYDPRATMSLGATLASRDVSIALTLVGYTAATRTPLPELAPGQPATESGVSMTLPVTWYATEDLTITTSLRASILGSHVNTYGGLRQGELFATLSIGYELSTVDSPMANAAAGR